MTTPKNDGDNVSQHFAEDVEPQFKSSHVHVKDEDRAAQLIGDQQVEVSEEDVWLSYSYPGIRQGAKLTPILLLEQTHSSQDR